MRVRTAASASSREGFGTIGCGADRTWSDRGLSDRGDFGQGLTTASIRGLSVRPAQKAGGVTGAAASVIRALGDSTHARRPDAAFPFYMAPCWWRSLPARQPSLLLAPAGQSLYIRQNRSCNQGIGRINRIRTPC